MAIHADDDPVGVEKILDRGSFPQKLWIGCHVIMQAVCAMHRSCFRSCAPVWTGTVLFSITSRYPEARLAIVRATPSMADRSASPLAKRRRSDADEDRFAPGDCVFGGSETQPAGLATLLITSSRWGSKSGMTPFCSFASFCDVAFTAKDVVANLRQASRGGETHIARAND